MLFFLSDDGGSELLAVHIETDSFEKPFLGGFRILPEDIEYHHACVQTDKVRIKKDSRTGEYIGKNLPSWNGYPE